MLGPCQSLPLQNLLFPCPGSQIKQVKDFLWLSDGGAVSTALLFQGFAIVCGSCFSSGHSSCGNKQELQMRGVQHHRSQWISQKPKQQPMCLYREEWNSACSLINDFLKVLTHRKQTPDKYSLNPLKKTKPQTPHLKHNLSCLKASFGFLLMP